MREAADGYHKEAIELLGRGRPDRATILSLGRDSWRIRTESTLCPESYRKCYQPQGNSGISKIEKQAREL